MSIEAMKFARDWIAEKPALRPCSAGKVVSMLTTAIAAAEKAAPVWVQPDHLEKARLAPFLCRVEPQQRDDFVSCYPLPPDTAAMLAEKDALLRQALEALENGARVRNAEGGTKYQPPIEEAAIEAIRNHLGVKND